MSRGRSALLLLLVLDCALVQLAPAQTLIATVPAGAAPVALAIATATNEIFAVNNSSNNVTVINGATNSVAAVVPVGQSPVAAAANPLTDRVYVANCGSDPTCNSAGTVAVIDVASNSLIANLTVGASPLAVAVDPASNKIYVVNQYSNSVTVIDGSTNSILATVPVGVRPQAVAINSTTNKAYVANVGDGSVTIIGWKNNAPTTATLYTHAGDPCAAGVNSSTNRIYVANYPKTVSVIDGGSDTLITNVPVGAYPCAVAVNPVSNKIYVANSSDGTVSVIDGTKNTATTVAVGGYPGALSVAAATNEIYVTDSQHNLITIDGEDDSVAGRVLVGYAPVAVAINAASNTIYVANNLSNTVSVVAGAGSPPPFPPPLQFIPVTPCRVADTRNPQGPFGGPSLSGRTARDFAVPGSACRIPWSASAYSMNVTVVPHGPLNYLTVWPSGQDLPTVSTLNSLDGRVKANAAIVPAGVDGAISVFATDATDVILDINGYFADPTGSTLAFYSLNPCRVVDTRAPNGPLGGPFLSGGAAGRDFLMTSSGCNIPGSALAYSLNFTAVPRKPLGYLTTWPAGQSQPLVSTLNAPTGVVTANAAIVPAGSGGDIDVFVSDDSDVIIDINGYFAAAAPSGLSLYATAP